MTIAVVASADDYRRPRGWRAVDAWREEEVRPNGVAGALAWHFWTARGIRDGASAAPDLSDCLAVPLGRTRLIVWEPLITKAPGPHLSQPWCCYIQTVIFYTRPYTINRFKRWWRSEKGGWRESETVSFFEWDHIESRLGWNDQLTFSGRIFEYGGGRVLWTAPAGERRRWWMRHGLRQQEARW